MAIGSYHFIVALVAAWLTREQASVIKYLQEENKVLRDQLGSKRIRFSDSQRVRLARKGKVVGRRGLRGLDCIVTPETILRWYRQLVAKKYDGSGSRGRLGRPRTAAELGALVLSLAVGLRQQQPSLSLWWPHDHPSLWPTVVGRRRSVLDDLETQSIDEEPDCHVVVLDDQSAALDVHAATLGQAPPL